MNAELMLFTMLILVSLCAWLCRRYPAYIGRIISLTLVLFILSIPLWNLLPGLAYYTYLCHSEAEQDTYRKLIAPMSYQLQNGSPNIHDIRRDLVDLRHDVEFNPLGIFRIARHTIYVIDRISHKTLGTVVDFAHDGGWLLGTVLPVHSSHSCWAEQERLSVDRVITQVTHFQDDPIFSP